MRSSSRIAGLSPMIMSDLRRHVGPDSTGFGLATSSGSIMRASSSALGIPGSHNVGVARRTGSSPTTISGTCSGRPLSSSISSSHGRSRPPSPLCRTSAWALCRMSCSNNRPSGHCRGITVHAPASLTTCVRVSRGAELAAHTPMLSVSPLIALY